MEDKSLYGRINNKEESADTNEDKMIEMWEMLDDGQKQEILGKMEEMCNYKEEDDSEVEGEDKPKGGVAIVIQAKK